MLISSKLFARLYADVLRDLLAEPARRDAIEGEWVEVDDVARPVDTFATVRQRANVAANEQQEQR